MNHQRRVIVVPIDNRCLAEREGETARCQRQRYGVAIQITKDKISLFGQQLARLEKYRVETQDPVIDANTQFGEPREDVFFDLTGHTRLLNTGMLGRVRIGIGWKSTVLLQASW